ncbi:nitroreductase family protein [Pseudomonas sp. p1(2021b)]|uniref:nitroreductase family protein n=1 Tax=Pseudomonas sp. p1(2021b) TaxID=2874628 RepID=UPI001CCC7C07|nr:nitroreductase family protein [Pseudomonas sp. p1(2021b)]UBM26570.1 nitroreductase family protein [Pseudomonas sp. p1(2021b)]
MWKKIRPYAQGCYRLLDTANGFLYDFIRFFKYGGWPGKLSDKAQRDYGLIMRYHGLEKSLSYKERNPSAGWRNAFDTLSFIEAAHLHGEIGPVDVAAVKVLEKFISLPGNEKDIRSKNIKERLKVINAEVGEDHGAIDYSHLDFLRGMLQSPEDFFFSRYSLREFKDKAVSKSVIERAVSLAMKTPSVCNRQAWAVYNASEKMVRDVVLSHQNGNKPFGDKVPNVLVVAADLRAFFTGREHYQHWIDGGLFSMSLMYAFHSLGLATCPLNWSQTPAMDKSLRSKLCIKDSHTIIMVIAVGYPDEHNKVCVSARRSLSEVVFDLKLK